MIHPVERVGDKVHLRTEAKSVQLHKLTQRQALGLAAQLVAACDEDLSDFMAGLRGAAGTAARGLDFLREVKKLFGDGDEGGPKT